MSFHTAFAGGLGGVAGGIIGQATSYGLNAASASKAHDRQKNMMTRGYLYNMIGLKAAGINPILAAGSGISGGPQGSAVQQAHASQSGKANPGLEAMQSMNLAAQTSASDASAEHQRALARGADFDNIGKGAEATFWGSPEGARIVRQGNITRALPQTPAGVGANILYQGANSAKDAAEAPRKPRKFLGFPIPKHLNHPSNTRHRQPSPHIVPGDATRRGYGTDR